VRNRTLKPNDIKARTMPLCRGAFDAEYKELSQIEEQKKLLFEENFYQSDVARLQSASMEDLSSVVVQSF
jgi:hypothetical protein